MDRTGTEYHKPLVADSIDPQKADYDETVLERRYDPNNPGVLEAGDEVVDKGDGTQIVRRTVREDRKPRVGISGVNFRPEVFIDGETWFIGKVYIANMTRSMEITDVQITYVEGDARTVLMGGKRVDTSNPLRNRTIASRVALGIQISCPVNRRSKDNVSADQYVEAEIVVNGPPGIVIAQEDVELVTVGLDGKPLPKGPFRPDRKWRPGGGYGP